MTLNYNSFKIGINVFVIKDGRLLLGKRKFIFGDGSWGLPGGHLETGEHIKAAAKRELKEETNLDCSEFDLVNIVNDINDNDHRLQIGLIADNFSGNLINNEPDKCYGWEWFELESLPKPIFSGHLSQIRGFINQQGTLIEND